MAKRISKRTAERLYRQAMELDYLASVLESEGYSSVAENVRHAERELRYASSRLITRLAPREAA